MKVIIVVGARPNFMKAAPIIAAMRKHNASLSTTAADLQHIDHVLVHTGQHYDLHMSDSFFTDLQLPAPDIHLGIQPGPASVQTGQILERFSEVLIRERPDAVVVVGDVNSTLACALATAKVSFDAIGTRPLLVHVEAGLRSFDRTMPEEINRIVTDHVADLLFVTEESGMHNLEREGIPADRTYLVGNTMIDSLLSCRNKADNSLVLDRLRLRKEDRSISPYAVLTLHRPSNVDNPDAFREILGGLAELEASFPIVFPVHPRTRQRIQQFDLTPDLNRSVDTNSHAHKGLIPTDPLGYLDFLFLMSHAALIVTDSGGIQEETTCLGIPCVTVRENTERPATVTKGTNILAGTKKEGIARAIRKQMEPVGRTAPLEYWDGQAASRIVKVLLGVFDERTSQRPALIPA